MKKSIVLVAFLIVLARPIYADVSILPLLNKKDFSCWFNICSFPNFIATDFTYSCSCTNTTNIYNITNNYTQNETEPMFNANFTIFNPFYNQTTPAINYFNSNPFNWLNSTYNATYDLKFNTTATTNLNMTTKNITFNLISASAPTCILFYNTTGSIKFCDCYNNTHKWVSNVC